jgi:ribonuclease HI
LTKLVVHVDGGARGNPGPAAVGVVIAEPGGEVVHAVGETIGVATNNVAEYRALLRGIELARERGASELEIYGDSELVVKQVRGEYKVKDSGLKPLAAEARAALAEVGAWTFDHVRRDDNAHADELVNQALDAAS